MNQNNERDQREQGSKSDQKSENVGGREDLQPDLGSLFHSVRDFLKQEEQTYGRFQIPELPDTPSTSRATHTSETEISLTGAPLTGTSESETPATAASETGTTASGRSETQTTAFDTPARPGEEKMPPMTDNEKRLKDSPADNQDQQKAQGSPTGPAAARTLEELFEICLTADVLRTDLADTRLVFGTGNPNADLMLIGEAPGLQEDKQGEPFVGKAGQLLNKILAAISFRREDVYIANILKHRPPNNRDPLPEERDRSLPYLYRQIELIQPKLILCLGRISVQTLLNTSEPMKNLRSRFHPFHNGIELLVTFHPAALLRNPAWKRDTWEDVQLLRKRYDELAGNDR